MELYKHVNGKQLLDAYASYINASAKGKAATNPLTRLDAVMYNGIPIAFTPTGKPLGLVINDK